MNRPFFRGANALSYLLLSLALGVIIWLSASNDELQRTEYPRTGEGPLLVELINLGEDLVVTSGADSRVTADLLMDLNLRSELTLDDFRVYADLAGLGPGRHQVRVNVERSELAPHFRLVEWFPNRITVELEEARTVTLPVDVSIADPQSVGVDYEVGDVQVDPDSVTITGPIELVDQIDRVVANVQLSGVTATITRTVDLSVESLESTIPMEDLLLSDEQAQVIVPIEQRPGFSTLTVLPDIVGEAELLDRGFWISRRTTSPESITVGGDREAIEQLSGVVRTDPIDISDFDENATQTIIERQVGLQLPADITPSRSDRVTVTLEIRTQDSSRTVKIAPTVVGLQPGLRVAANGIVPSTIDVLLAGPIVELREIETESIIAELDMEGLGAGVHEVPVQVQDVGNLTAESVIPEAVTVTVEEEQGDRSFLVPVRVTGLPEEYVGVAEPRYISVTLAGPVPTLNELDPLTLEASANLTAPVVEPTPVGVTVTAPARLDVTRLEAAEVFVRTYEVGQLTRIVTSLEILGVGENLEIEVSSTAIRLQIRVPTGAPPPTGEAVQASIDASDLTEGNYLLPVDVTLPPGYELATVIPDRVSLQLAPPP